MSGSVRRSFAAIDLSRSPPPKVVEPLSYEAILAAMVADLVARDPAYSALLESDPAMKILEVAAARELLLRQRVNDAARSVMLAFAAGSDLEHLGALVGVARQAGESDDRLRRRIQLAPEAFTTAGSVGAYVFHALAADPRVRDVSVTSPGPGRVVVTILSSEADGLPSDDVIEAVRARLNGDDVRPLTDSVTVRRPTVAAFDIAARLYLYDGPDAAVVEAEARASLAAYLEGAFAIGRDVPRSAIFAALHRPGVQRVELPSPPADVVVDDISVARSRSVSVAVVGRDE